MENKPTPKAKLEDLGVIEISLVDRPANKRKFLVIKNEEGTSIIRSNLYTAQSESNLPQVMTNSEANLVSNLINTQDKGSKFMDKTKVKEIIKRIACLFVPILKMTKDDFESNLNIVSKNINEVNELYCQIQGSEKPSMREVAKMDWSIKDFVQQALVGLLNVFFTLEDKSSDEPMIPPDISDAMIAVKNVIDNLFSANIQTKEVAKNVNTPQDNLGKLEENHIVTVRHDTTGFDDVRIADMLEKVEKNNNNFDSLQKIVENQKQLIEKYKTDVLEMKQLFDSKIVEISKNINDIKNGKPGFDQDPVVVEKKTSKWSNVITI